MTYFIFTIINYCFISYLIIPAYLVWCYSETQMIWKDYIIALMFFIFSQIVLSIIIVVSIYDSLSTPEEA